MGTARCAFAHPAAWKERQMSAKSRWITLAALMVMSAAPAQAADPIKIGLGMSLTGKLAANGKNALLSMQIWEDDTNAQGGLLGRPVKLVYYDDQSDPGQVPGIYAKLLDIDKVDLIVSGYASTQIAAAMPLAMERKKIFMGLSGTAVNEQFQYPMYFAMTPNGPDPKPAFTNGFFKVAEAQNPKPQTVAIAYADAEFGQNVCDGARTNAKTSGFRIVYDKNYPPATVDFSPIVRAIAARNPDLLVICSYPLDTIGIVKAIHEIGFKPKMWGGAMVGLQATALKAQLGPLLNGIVNFETWMPVKGLETPAAADFLKKYEIRAKAAGADALAFFPVMAYADLQVVGQAIAATKSLKDDVLAAYMHKAEFKTVVGNFSFGADGEWSQNQMLEAQFQNIESNSPDQFRELKAEVVVYPPQLKNGELIYPYEKVIGK
jgi:branched-chain amino acid transport system substrate-binding protein